MRLTVSIDDDKTIPLATLVEFITDQNVESVLLEGLVESLGAGHVEALCGGKHANGNGQQRFQRAGTDTRTAVTTAGEHEFSLHYVEDTAADHNESSYFRPVEDVLSFDGQNRYQQDIAAKSVDLATSLSYRDAADHGDGILSEMPSPTTINRRARNTGVNSSSSFRTLSLTQTLPLLFLTARSAVYGGVTVCSPSGLPPRV